MLKALLSNKEKLLELANTPFNENCSAVILKKLPEKLGDLGKCIISCGFNPNNDLVDTILEMFTNEHTLDYSSPSLYYDVDDDLVELESDNDDIYDDPFDSKEDKIKESKLLIDELDPP
uniref:Reverse transcriptase domain-containing protein n=1 Tax=Tanacetum cinerariifolium TaxID=118510 RepID=A0A6L2LEK2_TANCI|nr:reverse transcriptase domain-containing protein [Tanacetum cinerariifolium]